MPTNSQALRSDERRVTQRAVWDAIRVLQICIEVLMDTDTTHDFVLYVMCAVCLG